ncbi:F-box protein [Trifolium medium]|uniref:F-box protein n=1 Tax=Trifolium medium TaxID=97028 RepID=A0A392RPZ1_9FABA|nr:F-box protein [Trifolium medium]
MVGIQKELIPYSVLTRLRNELSSPSFVVFEENYGVKDDLAVIMKCLKSRASNESDQLVNSSKFDSIIDSLNLVHEPNDLNLS